MFKYSVDNKETYVNEDGITMLDLTKSVFGRNPEEPTISSMYRVRKEYEMRPDLVAKAAYGNEQYTEFLLKYSGIDNPFAIEKDDVVFVASVDTVTNPVDTTLKLDDRSTYDAIKAYHKYIDPSKVPSSNSEKNNISTGSSDDGSDNMEPNISKDNESGITIKNGRVYFGNVPSAVKDEVVVDASGNTTSDLVDCAENGVTLGQFLKATLKNSNK